MRTFKVGELFESGKTRYQEGIKFEFDNSGANLFMFYDRPTSAETKDIREGSAKFELFYDKEILFILAKYGNQPWIDAPYNINLSKPFVFQNLADGEGYGLTVYLVDASTGILKALRLIGLPTDFSKKFRALAEEQKRENFNPVEYDKNLNLIYNQMTTDQMVSKSIK